MRRVVVIGPPGGGKSTLARKLADITGLPLFHQDQMYWGTGWVERPREDFLASLRSALEGKEWIIDGNFVTTLQERLDRADTIIYLDFSTAKCLWRVCKRVVASYGKVRPDMAEGCPERFDWEFMCFIASFRRKRRPEIEELLDKNRDKRVTRLQSQREIDTFLESLAVEAD